MQQIGRKKPNRWGLYDMLGNAPEWCNDWFAEYSAGPVTDPSGPEDGSKRVVKGGDAWTPARFCLPAHRRAGSPGDGNGLRLVVTYDEEVRAEAADREGP